MKKPKLQDLQGFAKKYLKISIKVKWENWENKQRVYGFAVLDKNIIVLHQEIPVNLRVSSLSEGKRKIAPVFDGGEQYFYILLHEIGHFLFGLDEIRVEDFAKKEFKKQRRPVIWKYLNIKNGKDLYAISN